MNIVLIGYRGTGKSVVAALLSERLKMKSIGIDNVIVDTGGGVIERPENIETLKKNALIFWLKASVDVIVKRIESGADRPALTEGKSFTDEVAEVLEKRMLRYSNAARYEIDTSQITPEQVADKIIEVWERL